MTTYEDIKTYAENLASHFRPEKIILFGSYASDSAGEDSDVDLLVIMPFEGKASQQALNIRRHVPKRFPLDLVVQSPEEARRRLHSGDPFNKDVLSRGRVLYAKS